MVKRKMGVDCNSRSMRWQQVAMAVTVLTRLVKTPLAGVALAKVAMATAGIGSTSASGKTGLGWF